MAKYVYSFSEGYGKSKNILGGKGVGLAEMAHLKIPIPPGFTITTEVCTAFYENKGHYPQGLKEQVLKALQKMEKDSGMKFGDPKNPLLCSARSGARSSMPGMMETVLNIGLTSKTIAGMIEKTKNPRFVWDSYRRLIQMYSDVVMEKAEGIEPEEGMGVRQQLERELAAMKARRNAKLDVRYLIGGLKEYPMNGALRSTYRPWYLAIWVTIRPPAWPSPGIRPPARTNFTASGCPTLRAKMWSRESAHPIR